MSDHYQDDYTIPNQQPRWQPTEPSIPSATGSPPVYSTSDYLNRRVAPPPPPPERMSPARERVRRRRVNGRSSFEWAWVIVAAAMFGVVLTVSLSTFIFVRAAQSEVEIIPTASIADLLPTPVVAYSDFSNDLALNIGEQLLMPDGESIRLVPWDGVSRFTVLVVGLDRRPGERGLAYRTDTMMLISLDPETDSIGVLSIPRDLYVQVPGYSQLQRVNSPMVFGENRQPGYGPTLMMQTVQLNLGIIVNDYVAIDFQAFIDLIDAIGGINITTEYTINDPLYPNMNYGYDPFYLPAGSHLLNGYDALRFARTRHGDNDIRRAERQQQVVYAVRERMTNLDMLPSLILKAPSLWNSLQDNLYTGLSLEQVIQLGLYAKDIPLENIKMGVIDYRYLRSYTTPSGASVLIPDRARLGNLMVDVFGTNYTRS